MKQSKIKQHKKYETKEYYATTVTKITQTKRISFSFLKFRRKKHAIETMVTKRSNIIKMNIKTTIQFNAHETRRGNHKHKSVHLQVFVPEEHLVLY